MAIGVDTTNRKPRQFRGTPAFRYRNYITLGVLSVGVLCGVLFSVSPITRNFRLKSQEFAYHVSEEEKKHAALMSESVNSFVSAEKMRKTIEEIFSKPSH